MFAVVGLSACCNITINFVCAFMCSLSIKSGADTWRQSQKLKTGTKMATFSSFQKHVNPQRTPTQQHQKANNRYMLGPLWIHQNKDDVFWGFFYAAIGLIKQDVIVCLSCRLTVVSTQMITLPGLLTCYQ